MLILNHFQQYKLKKKFGSKYEVDHNLSEKIRNRNLMDWELYNFAKEKFFFENLNNNIFYK